MKQIHHEFIFCEFFEAEEELVHKSEIPRRLVRLARPIILAVANRFIVKQI